MPILSSEIKFYKSSSGVGLGGAISGTQIVDGALNNLFDDVTSTEALAGATEYRCLYVKNDNATINLLNTIMYVQSDSTSPDTVIDIGLGTAGPNSTEGTIPNETTAPGGVVFVTGVGSSNSISIGQLDANGGYHAVWIRRTVSASATATASDSSTLTVQGETTA